MTSRRDTLMRAASHLAEAGVPNPDRDARLLMRWASGLDGAGLASRLGETLPTPEVDRFKQAIKDRAARRPVSQIIGSRQFWGRSFTVTKDVLDPRPETEGIVYEALKKKSSRILDLGTGSGCLLITLLCEWPDATGVGTEISTEALTVARENAFRQGVSGRASFIESNWLESVDGTFDLIVSNPPYLSSSELAEVAPELRFEPAIALSPGGDGLSAYRSILEMAGHLLIPGGRILLEIGAEQGAAVMTLARENRFTDIVLHQDMDGRDRVILGHKATKS